MSSEKIASELLAMAARLSVQTQFGWAHPDCHVLQEAARILRCERTDDTSSRPVEGVLSRLSPAETE